MGKRMHSPSDQGQAMTEWCHRERTLGVCVAIWIKIASHSTLAMTGKVSSRTNAGCSCGDLDKDCFAKNARNDREAIDCFAQCARNDREAVDCFAQCARNDRAGVSSFHEWSSLSDRGQAMTIKKTTPNIVWSGKVPLEEFESSTFCSASKRSIQLRYRGMPSKED